MSENILIINKRTKFKKGFRGRFALYIPPPMKLLGLAELEHSAKNNRMRAKCGIMPSSADSKKKTLNAP